MQVFKGQNFICGLLVGAYCDRIGSPDNIFHTSGLSFHILVFSLPTSSLCLSFLSRPLWHRIFMKDSFLTVYFPIWIFNHLFLISWQFLLPGPYLTYFAYNFIAVNWPMSHRYNNALLYRVREIIEWYSLGSLHRSVPLTD